MAIGFTTTGYGNRQIKPDKTMTRTSTPTVRKISFGDGYEQRVAGGINNLKQSFTVSFNNREKEEIDDITAYLDSLNGVSKFSFTIPDSNAASNDETTIKVVCDTVSQAYNYGGFYSANATFRRVYEA
jgi:phage-related protein